MDFQEDAPIVQKIYDFYKIAYETIKLFPRDDKFTLGARIQSFILDSLKQVCEAQYSEKDQKVLLLKQSTVKVDHLKILFRACFDLKIINQKKYLGLEEKLQEIGRMLGGWLRSSKSI